MEVVANFIASGIHHFTDFLLCFLWVPALIRFINLVWNLWIVIYLRSKIYLTTNDKLQSLLFCILFLCSPVKVVTMVGRGDCFHSIRSSEINIVFPFCTRIKERTFIVVDMIYAVVLLHNSSLKQFIHRCVARIFCCIKRLLIDTVS